MIQSFVQFTLSLVLSLIQFLVWSLNRFLVLSLIQFLVLSLIQFLVSSLIVIVFDYCQSQKLAVVVIVLAIGKPVRDIVFLYSLISCFVVVFVHFSLFLLLFLLQWLWLVVAIGEQLWERKWRRNLGHGPPPSEPSTYSYCDDHDDHDDEGFGDDEPQHILIGEHYQQKVTKAAKFAAFSRDPADPSKLSISAY